MRKGGTHLTRKHASLAIPRLSRVGFQRVECDPLIIFTNLGSCPKLHKNTSEFSQALFISIVKCLSEPSQSVSESVRGFERYCHNVCNNNVLSVSTHYALWGEGHLVSFRG